MLSHTDIDECTSGTHNCNANAHCSNTIGSFTCNCVQGYSGNGVECSGTFVGAWALYILIRGDQSFLHLRVISYFNHIYYYSISRNYCTSSANWTVLDVKPQIWTTEGSAFASGSSGYIVTSTEGIKPLYWPITLIMNNARGDHDNTICP